jgi:hypothetical protein
MVRFYIDCIYVSLVDFHTRVFTACSMKQYLPSPAKIFTKRRVYDVRTINVFTADLLMTN